MDMDGDNKPEIVAGVNIYKVNITNYSGTSGNSIDLLPGMQLNTSHLPANATSDGATQVVDIDNDGQLEVVVFSKNSNNRVVVYVWKPLPNNQSHLMGSYLVPATNIPHYSIPMLGNIDSTPTPEIVFITNGSQERMYALKYDPSASVGNQISLKWELVHTDNSGCTGATLFDFNGDGKNEIVYRDEQTLRILDGGETTADTLAIFKNVSSGTLREFPVIADVDGDGQAEIIVSGWDNVNKTIDGIPANVQNGYLRVFKSNGSPWAPARKVWNQYAYNAVNVNEDLTIPAKQFHPATLFPNGKRPFNNFMQQQTLLNKDGDPLWAAPDAYFDPLQSGAARTEREDSITVRLCIINQGDAPIGAPVYVAVYKDNISSTNIIKIDSLDGIIQPGSTGCMTIGIPHIEDYLPFANLVIRVNDKGGTTFPVQPECDEQNNELTLRNPAVALMMKKKASLNGGATDNGTYPNPVSVLYGDKITYTIKAVNANPQTGRVIVTDTLPPYLDIDPASLSFSSGSGAITPDITYAVPGTPVQRVTWTISNILSLDSAFMTYDATPASGACASQPLYINKAWVNVVMSLNDTVRVHTNSTYHQGAGISIVTFSATVGGQLFNAREQALDYRTSPRAGILIVPDSGYTFAGWSHDEYVSLRGEKIAADSGITHYEDIVIYGNVELRARFVPTVKPAEREIVQEKVFDTDDKVWSHAGDIYVRTKKGALTRIYSTEGILQRQLIITDDGTTSIRMERGVYVATLDDGLGWKVVIE
jgi:uncharacterized repeat protein (TIGR01451 family)